MDRKEGVDDYISAYVNDALKQFFQVVYVLSIMICLPGNSLCLSVLFPNSFLSINIISILGNVYCKCEMFLLF